MAQDNVKPSRFANLPGWAYLILTGLLVAGWGAAIYALFSLLPTWEHRILVGLLTFLAFMLAWMIRNMRESEADRNCAPIPDAASVEEQEAALAHLTRLPHMHPLADGALFNYLQGSYIKACRCGKDSPLHLNVHYGLGRRYSITLVSRGALSRFLAVQDAVAAGLRQAGGTA